jgi:hypothetical protein
VAALHRAHRLEERGVGRQRAWISGHEAIDRVRAVDLAAEDASQYVALGQDPDQLRSVAHQDRIAAGRAHRLDRRLQ